MHDLVGAFQGSLKVSQNKYFILIKTTALNHATFLEIMCSGTKQMVIKGNKLQLLKWLLGN